tara:strand:+ start:39 stop:1349 length:1311 start_codon:yes stop_codon:yes gene_type:complete
MAVNYLQDYLGINPNDYSAMEQGIAGISPLAPGQSIIPQTASMPRASIMSEGDFANATAPLMNRVYGREQEARATADGLANQLQGLQSNLQEVTQLRDRAVQDYQDSLQQQDIMRQQAAEDQARQLEEQRNSLLQEREGIITTLEQDFGVQRSELESLVGSLEGKVGELESERGSLQGEISNLSSQMQSLETEKQDALAQQDVIRAESAQAQQDALAQQAEQFTGERSSLEQQIADLQAQVGQQQPPVDVPPTGGPLTEPIAMPRNPEMVKMIQDKMGQDQLFIDDNPRRFDDKVVERGGITRRPFLDELPPMPPKRDDFMSIDRKPNRSVPPMVQKPFVAELDPMETKRRDFMSIAQEPSEIGLQLQKQQEEMRKLGIGPEFSRASPINTMTPPRKEIGVPMMGGGFRNPKGRPMMRANGGTISQAISDLQSRLK